MPLRDHFHPPVADRLPWSSLFAGWLNLIADRIVELTTDEFRVDVSVKSAPGWTVDVKTTMGPDRTPPWLSDWQPGAAPASGPITFPDRYELQVHRQFGGWQLVSVIVLVTPGNKSSVDACRALAAKVATYLHDGICVLVVDVETRHRANLHNALVRLMRLPDSVLLPEEQGLYAVTYRPVIREQRAEIDIWVTPFAIGDPLPTMPLRLIAD